MKGIMGDNITQVYFGSDNIQLDKLHIFDEGYSFDGIQTSLNSIDTYNSTSKTASSQSSAIKFEIEKITHDMVSNHVVSQEEIKNNFDNSTTNKEISQYFNTFYGASRPLNSSYFVVGHLQQSDENPIFAYSQTPQNILNEQISQPLSNQSVLGFNTGQVQDSTQHNSLHYLVTGNMKNIPTTSVIPKSNRIKCNFYYTHKSTSSTKSIDDFVISHSFKPEVQTKDDYFSFEFTYLLRNTTLLQSNHSLMCKYNSPRNGYYLLQVDTSTSKVDTTNQYNTQILDDISKDIHPHMRFIDVIQTKNKATTASLYNLKFMNIFLQNYKTEVRKSKFRMKMTFKPNLQHIYQKPFADSTDYSYRNTDYTDYTQQNNHNSNLTLPFFNNEIIYIKYTNIGNELSRGFYVHYLNAFLRIKKKEENNTIQCKFVDTQKNKDEDTRREYIVTGTIVTQDDAFSTPNLIFNPLLVFQFAPSHNSRDKDVVIAPQAGSTLTITCENAVITRINDSNNPIANILPIQIISSIANKLQDGDITISNIIHGEKMRTTNLSDATIPKYIYDYSCYSPYCTFYEASPTTHIILLSSLSVFVLCIFIGYLAILYTRADEARQKLIDSGEPESGDTTVLTQTKDSHKYTAINQAGDGDDGINDGYSPVTTSTTSTTSTHSRNRDILKSKYSKVSAQSDYEEQLLNNDIIQPDVYGDRTTTFSDDINDDDFITHMSDYTSYVPPEQNSSYTINPC